MVRLLVWLLVIVPAGAWADDMRDKLYAVHATDELPVGVLKAGYGKDEGELAGVRTTVHFAIGELVRPVGKWMSWEKKKYAVVAPLRALLPQLVNLNCYDSFIVGDLEITDEMIVVAPVGTVGNKVWVYDAETVTLREAVDQAIASLGGWKVTMSGKNKHEQYLPAYVDGKDINTFEFFSQLLEELPHLSLGLRWDPHHGEAWRLAWLEMELVSVHKEPHLDHTDTWQSINEKKEVIRKTYLDSTLCEKSKLALLRLLDL